ncbi:hypothetical protein ACWENA_36470 [Streptomyces sp. NPDC004779]|uniref:hypothetical protein n=1 Tax=unclassified Streptomyces TaxID=2593676 RepID=UPI0035D89261
MRTSYSRASLKGQGLGTGGTIVGKKQTRVNKGARTGGHEHREAVTAKEKGGTAAASEAPRSVIETASHRKERKFGHN